MHTSLILRQFLNLDFLQKRTRRFHCHLFRQGMSSLLSCCPVGSSHSALQLVYYSVSVRSRATGIMCPVLLCISIHICSCQTAIYRPACPRMARSAMRVCWGPRWVDIIGWRAIYTLVNILVKKGKHVIELLRTFQRKGKMEET